jgi:FMN reductase
MPMHGRKVAVAGPSSGPLVVAIGGSLRPNSATEQVLQSVLDELGRLGARTRLYSGQSLLLHPYAPGVGSQPHVADLLQSVRDADALVLGSPGYHGGISGLVKNAIDYLEELRDDPAPYLDGKPVGCVATADGWQTAVSVLCSLRQIVHALRGWPTPYGIALNVRPDAMTAVPGVPEPDVTQQVTILAGQILQFVSAFHEIRAQAR